MLIRRRIRRIFDFIERWINRIQWLYALVGALTGGGIGLSIPQTPAWAIFAFALTGAAIAVGVAVLWQGWQPNVPISLSAPHDATQEEEGCISMEDAARKLYTEARRCGSLMATGAEQMSGWSHGQPTSGNIEDILDYMAGVIAAKKDVYAKRPPSTAREKVSKDSLKMYVFKDGATKLKHIFPNMPSEWADLAIRSADLDDLIAEVHFQSGFDEPK